LYQYTRRAIKLAVVNILGYHCHQLHTKILTNILLSKLSPYIDEIIGYHQCGFRHNRSNTDPIFYIHQILEKKWEYNETVHLYQLFVDFKNAYDSVSREVLYNIFIVSGVPTKLVRLIKMCLNETYTKVCISKHSIIFLSKVV
jgi:sorting nexin-29